MRHLWPNLLTASATLALLTALAWPAREALRGPAPAPAPALARPVGGERLLGVYVDPWHIDDWGRDVGVRPKMAATFEAFSRQRTLDAQIEELERQGVGRLLVSWEPWTPVPTTYGAIRQSYPQPGYTNADIARGAQDPYIRRFAQSLSAFHGIVYLRYAHEMNGAWYPWARGPRDYRRAWRRMVRIVRASGATNVRFVWSPNPSLFARYRPWLRHVLEYWPGSGYVDAVGSTVINFGGHKRYAVARFAPRLRALRRTFRKAILITEANTAARGRVAWLRGLRAMLARMPWVRGIAWSQLPSRGAAQMTRAGDLTWDVRRDPPAAAQLRALMRER
jgi:Glycosyl hydrolase family 26